MSKTIKILTGFAVIKDNVGNRIAYTTREVDELGAIVSSSFVVLDSETNNLVSRLEEKIKERIK